MATVTGYIRDFGQNVLTGAPQLRFKAREASSAGEILYAATEPVVVTPAADGSFSVNLAPTVGLEPATYYQVTAEWLDGISFTRREEWVNHLEVPVEGGTIGDLINSGTVLPLPLVLQMPARISIPTEMGFVLPITIQRNLGGGYTTNLVPEALHTPASGPTYYVDKATGTSGGDGLTWETAIRLPSQATVKNSGDAATIIIKGGIYTRNEIPTSLWRAGCAIKAAPGERVIFVMGDVGTSLTWTSRGGGAFSTPLTTVNGVIDDGIRDSDGLPTEPSLVESAAAVSLTPDSWFADATTLYVHLKDGRQPDANAYISRSISGLRYLTTLTDPVISAYMEGIEFWGGSSFSLYAPAANTQFYAKDCKWYFAKASNGVSVFGLARTALLNCEASHNYLDGFGYHENNGMDGQSVEVNCVGRWNGKIVGSQNGSTAHELWKIVRVGGDYSYNEGGNIADVNSAMSFNVGVSSHDSLGASYYDFYGANMWLDGCFSTSAIAFVAQPDDGTLRLRNCMFVGTQQGNVITY